MASEYEAEAMAEAERLSLSGEHIDEMRPLVSERLKALGSAGVRGHTVTYDPEAWSNLLPARVLSGRNGSISRGDVFDLAAEGDLIVAKRQKVSALVAMFLMPYSHENMDSSGLLN